MLIRVDSTYASQAIATRMNEYAEGTIEFNKLKRLYYGVNAPGSMMCEVSITHEEALLIFRCKNDLIALGIYDL